MAPIPDGRCSFVVKPGPWRALRYDGHYRDGLRDGLWRVTDAEHGTPRWETTWRLGEWHGRSTSWYQSGRKMQEGDYAYGCRSGIWRHWFETGQLAAEGPYQADRKVGRWQYWTESGEPAAYPDLEKLYHQWDWAYDDYTGMPRGENWPEPPTSGGST